MSSESPDVVLYDGSSNALAVQNGAAIPASTPALMFAGSDGANSRYVTLDGSGHPVIVGAGTAGSASGGVVTIQGIAGGTTVPVTATDAQTTETTVAWTSATTINSTVQLNVVGYGTATITLNQGTTLTGGVVTFEASDTIAGTNWYPIAVTPTIPGTPSSTYTLVASTNTSFMVGVGAFVLIRARLSTVITGTGTVNVGLAAITSALEPLNAALTFDGVGNPINSLSEGVAGSTGLMVALGATNFPLSAGNSTTVQLAAGATFTGTIETVYNEQAISVLLTCDQPGTITLNQYIDAAGTRLAQSNAFYTGAGVGFSRSINANGNYFNLTFKNTGTATTTTLNINTAYGILPSQTNLGNFPIAINEINNVPITTPGQVPVDITQSDTVFKHVVVSGRLPQIQLSFNTVSPSILLTSTLTGTGSVAGPTTGAGSFSTGTGTTGRSLGVSFTNIAYTPHEEIFAAFTAAFTTGTTGTYQRIGLYNTVDGFSFGYNGTTFGLWTRFNSVDTFVAQASWNTDTLTGAPTSKFTRNNAPESLITTDLNLYRVRFGWLGIAPVIFEVLSADGNFVQVHVARYPNSQTTPSITNPYLPMTVDVNNNSTGTTNLTLTTGCWVAGTSVSPVVGSGLTASIQTANANGNTGAATTGSAVAGPTVGLGSLGFNLTGTWSGTIAFQFSMDGNIWDNVMCYNPQTGALQSTTTANGTWTVAVGAYRMFRTVATAWTSGTAIVTANAGLAPSFINTLTELTDNANNGPVAVKPATTSPTASDPALVVVMSPNQQPIAVTTAPATATTTGIAIGKVLMGGAVSNTKNAVRRTTYNEQTTGAQRSISSSSANDTSAGTGARQVKITYYTNDLVTKNTETVTLNGTTAVNTTNTNICFIESMVVTSVGSGGVNAGTITLFAGTGGTGGTIGTITIDVSATEVGIANQTYWAHHYVQSGKTCTIVSFDAGTQGNQNGEAFLSSVNPVSGSNSPDEQISDSITVGLNAGTTPRTVLNTIKVAGPARITMYIIPAGNNTKYFGSFDFWEQ